MFLSPHITQLQGELKKIFFRNRCSMFLSCVSYRKQRVNPPIIQNSIICFAIQNCGAFMSLIYSGYVMLVDLFCIFWKKLLTFYRLLILKVLLIRFKNFYKYLLILEKSLNTSNSPPLFSKRCVQYICFCELPLLTQHIREVKLQDARRTTYV